ncbi:TATA element modulatory factor 1 TATA binding domain-containing protein [Pochonia chlamydosporia 170]|uniref:TATA element modulatory factor 1 TATA binding domain-containing protein n=1 Tax=Pochonia chlamydosporia 170 TaxID=1380566 RepID=A0A179FFR7_METCM|nr:TATA element modulatory factor 1 TATA binding domain-containing protein [Pochonia chlamydosporia 170]OAQ64188.1 TATA element modulatory factor 1 TATA binding domain-containing protein [Pochonia chlamydosporia 170]
MAAPGKQSRWGSFLSQAVAGVESRLDNMLAEPEDARPQDSSAAASPADPASPAATTTKQQPASQQLAVPAKPSPGNSRSSSTSRTNDRLQARLAQAMSGKGTPGGPGSRGTASPRSSVDQPSRPSIERRSTDKRVESKAEDGSAISESTGAETSLAVVEPSEINPSEDATNTSADLSSIEPAPEVTNGESSTPEDSLQLSQQPKTVQEEPPAVTVPEIASENASYAKEIEELKVKQQEEIQEYVERIDSLQSKLQYLSKAAAETAKAAASSAPSGSNERKLAEKDEKIALLMEEGQKLSTNEHKLRTTIKKLRAQIGDNDKQAEELKRNRDKALSETDALRARLNGSEETEKRKEETRRATAALQKDIDTLKKDNAKKDDAYRRLDQEWKSKTEQAEIAHREAMNKALAAERQKLKTLEDTNSNLRAERDAAAEKARHDEIEWSEKLERAAERSRKSEEELKIELQAMEGKLEAMRTAAEEASSGSGGEAQVKMFRQIETLQSQYASARENWQGIEASLLAKTANLEKERDEAQRRESEMRKKARDAAVRSRHLEEELQDVQPSLVTVRQELEACRGDLIALQALYKESQVALDETREELEKAKENAAEREDPLEAQQQQWVDDVAGATSKGHRSQPDSPLLSVSRTYSSDMMGLGILSKPRRSHTPGSIPDSHAELMSPIRRLSCQPPLRPREASYAGSGPPPTPFSPFEPPSETGQLPSPPAAERENGVADAIPSSPRQVAQDMVSVSTVAAGPSVQLVERMSAAIRRLEAEKVTAKEEMARVSSQRDEARTDMVGLMKELEETKAAAAKLPQLEEEVKTIDARYQTTLEMLGEKSELVEELRADVEDVKAMYRELVERTIK